MLIQCILVSFEVLEDKQTRDEIDALRIKCRTCDRAMFLKDLKVIYWIFTFM